MRLMFAKRRKPAIETLQFTRDKKLTFFKKNLEQDITNYNKTNETTQGPNNDPHHRGLIHHGHCEHSTNTN